MSTVYIKPAELDAITERVEAIDCVVGEVSEMRWAISDIRTTMQCLDARLSMLEHRDADCYRSKLSPAVFAAIKEKVQSFLESYTEFSDAEAFERELALLLGMEASPC